MNRIIIAVRGGVVQEVRADDPENIDITIFDYDDFEDLVRNSVIDEEYSQLIKGTEVVL